MKYFFAIILSSIVFVFSGTVSAQSAPTATVLKSKKAVEKKLGSHIAKQVPTYFNFKTHVLVHIAQTNSEDPQLEIIDVQLLDYQSTFSPSPNVDSEISLRKSRVLIRLVDMGSPCSGGPPPSPEDEKRCRATEKQNREREMRTIQLLAVPKANQKVVVTTQTAQARP